MSYQPTPDEASFYAEVADVESEFEELEASGLYWDVGSISIHKSTELAKRLDSYPTYRRGFSFPLEENMTFVTAPFTRTDGSLGIAIVLWSSAKRYHAAWVRAERAELAEETCAFLNSELAKTWAYHRNPPPGDEERRQQARDRQAAQMEELRATGVLPPAGASVDEIVEQIKAMAGQSPAAAPPWATPRDQTRDYPGKQLGLPPPNKHLVVSCAVPGEELVGLIFQPKARAFRQRCRVEHPLARHGHVGVSFDGCQTIYAVALPDPDSLAKLGPDIAPPTLVIDTCEFDAAKAMHTTPTVAALSYTEQMKQTALERLEKLAGVARTADPIVGDSASPPEPMAASPYRAPAAMAPPPDTSTEQFAELAEGLIPEFHGLGDYGSEWMIGHIALWKSTELAQRPSKVPTYRRGLMFMLAEDMAFATVRFTRTTGEAAVGIVLTSPQQEFFACWVPAERASEAESVVRFLNRELTATWAFFRNPPRRAEAKRRKAIAAHARLIDELRANWMLPNCAEVADAVKRIKLWAPLSPIDRTSWPDSQVDGVAPRRLDDGTLAVGFFAELGYPGEWPSLAAAVGKRAPTHKAEVLRYLRGGKGFVALRTSPDVLNPHTLAAGRGTLSDGTYTWPNELEHYVDYYDVALPAEFEKHMARCQWKPARGY